MTPAELLTQTFVEHEYLSPDPSDVRRAIHQAVTRNERPRHGWLAPLVAAAAIVSIALALTLTHLGAGHTNHSARPARPARPTPTSVAATTNLEAAAGAAARAILRSVPLPSGARSVTAASAPLNQGGGLELSSLEAEATGRWVVPGTLAEVVAFAESHPAPGFAVNCTCGGRTVKWLDFYDKGQRRAISYDVVPYRGGLAIKITAIVPWAPIRPAWSYVAATATSVDVTVQRVRQAGTTGGAPTVRRTLVGEELHRLTSAANHLGSEAPSICAGPLIMIAATDVLVFHQPGRTVTFTMSAENCPQFAANTAGRQPAYLDAGPLDVALLRVLGLPPNYGR